MTICEYSQSPARDDGHGGDLDFVSTCNKTTALISWLERWPIALTGFSDYRVLVYSLIFDWRIGSTSSAVRTCVRQAINERVLPLSCPRGSARKISNGAWEWGEDEK